MNLNSLFAYQKELDDHIIKEKKITDGSLLNKKVIAFICELYETVNENRFFKYWSNKPADKEATLEEYSDTIHFLVSIANDMGYTYHTYEPKKWNMEDLVIRITNIATIIPVSEEEKHIRNLFNRVIDLGYMLGFDEDGVLQAYHAKHEVNYDRQASNY